MSQQDRLITIDFWDTLVIAEEGGEKRREARYNALREVSNEYVKTLSISEIEAASQEASEEFHRVWFNQQRTPTADELIREVMNILRIPATEMELDYLTRIFEESLLEGPPQLLDGAEETIHSLSGKYQLALISDTMYSPGRVIRTFLEDRKLLHYFDAFLFSDEAGFSKPNPKAFQKMLKDTDCEAERSYHIGDRLNTDIKGAKDVGMKAILFTGVSGKKKSREEDGTPDHTCESWEEIKELLLD